MDNTQLCKCGKVGKNSCPNDEICGNTQLPAEVVECIDSWLMTFALAYHRRKNKDIANDAAEFISDELKKHNALTEYATKLCEAQQEVERLKSELGVAIGANENLTSRMASWQQQLRGEQKKKDDARDLLEKVISRHEGVMIIANIELYNEIKTFLDGAK
jgi:hypothetical protein